jgi:hypothetical protein
MVPAPAATPRSGTRSSKIGVGTRTFNTLKPDRQETAKAKLFHEQAIFLYREPIVIWLFSLVGLHPPA